LGEEDQARSSSCSKVSVSEKKAPVRKEKGENSLLEDVRGFTIHCGGKEGRTEGESRSVSADYEVKNLTGERRNRTHSRTTSKRRKIEIAHFFFINWSGGDQATKEDQGEENWRPYALVKYVAQQSKNAVQPRNIHVGNKKSQKALLEIA